MKALVLAGGQGSSMAPFSQTRPNPMIPVAGRYVIDHTIEALRLAGVTIVNLVVGHKQEALRQRFSGDIHSEVKVNLVEQGKAAGIGGAILAARSQFLPGEHFLLVYADTLAGANIFSVTMQSFGISNEPTAAICLTQSAEKYGNVYLGADMKITKMVEKPKKAGLGNYVLAGVFALPTTFFDELEKAQANMEKALLTLIRQNSLRAAIWEDAWLDMAYPWDILTANKMIMDKWSMASIHNGVELHNTIIRGPVKICQGAQISPGVVLEGPAYIGAGSFVGHNTLIRPYTCVGAGCVVGHGAELKNSVIFDDSVIGGLCFIGDSVVGQGANIGSGTMTINRPLDGKKIKVRIGKAMVDTGLDKIGAFVGDGAKVGASNILAPGSVMAAKAIIPHNLSYPSRGGK
ncbi:MAG: sugar phosphate nucleotidyltransferase [Nitrospinota bacterium]|nr:sugar phosphate nucleotidyltransferase [Nitrospinota bacterium]MDH5678669.1 sugar phosphate nucleotidyltransferase [Nitrospinota bacterium]MDH5756894.1 sugar phosphate nucleotidyltransferase [Nitrospinota bacterium]